MSKVTTMLAAGVFIVLGFCALAQPTNPRFGYFLYKGPTSIDVYVPQLTDPAFTKAEFYVNGKKFGTANLNQPAPGLITATGLTYGPGIATLQVRFTMSNGSAARTGTVVNAPEFAKDNWGISQYEFYGILAREEQFNSSAKLSDTLYIYPEGELKGIAGNKILPTTIAGSSVAGGHFIFQSGADLDFDLSIGSNVAVIYVKNSANATLKPGKISATGGRLKNVLQVYCDGQFGPMKNWTVQATDVHITGTYPCRFEDCTFDWNNDKDYAYIGAPANHIIAIRCTLQNEAQIQSVDTARQCLVTKNAIMQAKHVTNCVFNDNAQLKLWPPNTPTYCANNTFLLGSALILSNKSIVELNTFEADCVVSINPLSGQFSSSDVGGVHVNYNHFMRIGGQGTVISNIGADSIDCTLNYWGRCEGPEPAEMTNRKVKYFPCLRDLWPKTSYWLDVSRSKDKVIANDEDELVFTFHCYNVVTKADSAGVEIDYLVRILGDTLTTGTLITDANGKAELKLKIPFAYSSALAVETHFYAFQCNDKSFITSVEKQQGADISLYTPKVIQVESGATDFVAGKGFAVRATIAATQPVTEPFRVIVRVNGEDFETFGELTDLNITPDYKFKATATEMTMPNNKSRTFIWFIDKTDITPGLVNVEVIIDPIEPGKPQGRIRESNESNNAASIPINFVATAWGNDGSSTAKLFVQPIDQFPRDPMPRLAGWVDSTIDFMHRAWPMKASTISYDAATSVRDYSWLEPDSLVQETWERYLVKAYKLTRIEHPAYDRYVFAVNENWFRTRFHQRLFNHKESQTLTYSGIYDLAVASTRHFKQLAHTLGHTWHLRRADFAPDDPEEIEEYGTVFLGKSIDEGYDNNSLRLMRTGLNNEAARPMQAYCFMGSSTTMIGTTPYYLWIAGSEYKKMTASLQSLNGGFSKSTQVPCMLIEGSIDSTTKQFTFEPWVKLDNAVPSAMVEDKYAKYIVKTLDASGAVLATHNYTPTFRAVGLDETDPSLAPKMEREYFAFAVPCPANAKKIVFENVTGQKVAERVISSNGPVVSIIPADQSKVEPPNVNASWSATDPDGETVFWYTVYFSEDNGAHWTLIQFESKATSTVLSNLSEKPGYKLKVIASDGINTTEAISTFEVTTVGVDRPVSPDVFALYQNYPNPFNPSTTLTYSLPSSTRISLSVYDAVGKLVATLVDDMASAGVHTVSFDATALPSGLYTAILKSDNAVSSIRMTLNK